jgi:spore maturation protein CgeB
MKILLSGYHNPDFITITEYIEEAAQRLGHEVIIFDDRRHLIPGRVRCRFRRLNDLDLLLINRNFLSLAWRTRPQLVVVTGGFRISGESIRLLKKEGIKTLLWTTDPPVHFEPVAESAPFYDVVCCQGTEAIDILKSKGVEDARWLPMACDPIYHRSTRMTQDEVRVFGSQVVFVGSYYFCREKLFKNLREFDFAIWGPGWGQLAQDPCFSGKVRGDKVPPEQWVKIYSACSIVLAPHFQDEHNRFPVHQISPRVFEAMACGSFVLSDRQEDVLALFRDGEHLVTFEDGKDLIDKIRYFLRCPEERKRIAAAGRCEVLRNHTYTHRMQHLLSLISGSERAPSRGEFPMAAGKGIKW